MILVTGATGHTGQRLVRRLLERGDAVRVLTRNPAKLPEGIGGRVELAQASLDDPAASGAATTGCSVVIAMTHIRFAPQVIAAAKAGEARRVIFMSSTRRFTQFPEETARAVILGEDQVRQSGLDWTIIRPSMIYGGPEDNNIEHLVRALRRWPVHPMVGGGRMRWQPVFTWDVVQALVAALDRPETIGHDYTVAGPEAISYREMVKTILDGTNRRVLLLPIPMAAARLAARMLGMVSTRPRITLDQIRRLEEDKVFDISPARRELGFDPVSFKEGIRRKLAGEA
ncbi:MAG: NAD(P)H-binding protein [Candidatus Sumerlaeaceae bacterium]|nr:NAD(P)H-binding protein [Candidatus Sumerlaeaceae bacterium]